jgi:hypothetical protein
MSEQDDEKSSSGFRRVRRKDRKRKLESRGPLIPPEPDEPTPEELFAPPEVRPAEVQPPPVVESPPTERFPPVALEEKSNRDTAQGVPTTPDVKPRSTFLPNLVAILFFAASILLIIVFSIIFVNPNTPLNPFPPFTPIPILITATFLPPTQGPPPTETAIPTLGPTATFTPIPAEAMPTTQASLFPFVAANGGAVFVPNGNDKECDWSSIAGSVTDMANAPLDGYGVHISGQSLDETVFTGSAQTFGPGAFELFLNGAPQVGIYAIQLLSPAGVPLSDVYTITTRATCEENVAVVSFLQTRAI